MKTKCFIWSRASLLSAPAGSANEMLGKKKIKRDSKNHNTVKKVIPHFSPFVLPAKKDKVGLELKDKKE